MAVAVDEPVGLAVEVEDAVSAVENDDDTVVSIVRIFVAELELEPEYDAVAEAANEANAEPVDELSALPDEFDAEAVVE